MTNKGDPKWSALIYKNLTILNRKFHKSRKIGEMWKPNVPFLFDFKPLLKLVKTALKLKPQSQKCIFKLGFFMDRFRNLILEARLIPCVKRYFFYSA